jgi:hypothetical protein
VIAAMGIESEQVVYDYLSRVGDLAQATSLTAAERARLVSELRETIDTRRGGSAGSSTSGFSRGEASAVRKILSGIGSPDEVVRRAVHDGVPRASEGRSERGRSERSGDGPSVPSKGVPAQGGPPPDGRTGRGADAGRGTEGWWSGGWAGSGGGGGWTSSGGSGPDLAAAQASTGGLPGWRADFEPDFLAPDGIDPATRAAVPPQPPVVDETGPQLGKAVAGPPPRSLLRRLLGPPQVVAPVETVAVAVPRSRLPLVESLAAVVLTASAVLGLWYAALIGWVLAYIGRRIGSRAAHLAGLWLPLLAACVFGFRLYRQVHGQPAGHPLTDDQFKAALRSAAGLWLRVAAGCSAAFLAWRIYRRP